MNENEKKRKCHFRGRTGKGERERENERFLFFIRQTSEHQSTVYCKFVANEYGNVRNK